MARHGFIIFSHFWLCSQAGRFIIFGRFRRAVVSLFSAISDTFGQCNQTRTQTHERYSKAFSQIHCRTCDPSRLREQPFNVRYACKKKQHTELVFLFLFLNW